MKKLSKIGVDLWLKENNVTETTFDKHCQKQTFQKMSHARGCAIAFQKPHFVDFTDSVFVYKVLSESYELIQIEVFEFQKQYDGSYVVQRWIEKHSR